MVSLGGRRDVIFTCLPYGTVQWLLQDKSFGKYPSSCDAAMEDIKAMVHFLSILNYYLSATYMYYGSKDTRATFAFLLLERKCTNIQGSGTSLTVTVVTVTGYYSLIIPNLKTTASWSKHGGDNINRRWNDTLKSPVPSSIFCVFMIVLFSNRWDRFRWYGLRKNVK